MNCTDCPMLDAATNTLNPVPWARSGAMPAYAAQKMEGSLTPFTSAGAHEMFAGTYADQLTQCSSTTDSIA